MKYDDRHYIVNIIFFINQINLKEGDNDYTSFIIRKNLHINDYDDIKYFDEIYADNVTYVVTLADSVEYTMSQMDYRFFHLGLYDKNYNYYMNGIFYNTFNLKYFYDY